MFLHHAAKASAKWFLVGVSRRFFLFIHGFKAPWKLQLIWSQYIFVGNHCLVRCRYTSGRTYFTPLGNTGYQFVSDGTILSSRCALLILVCCWRNLRWLLEQPDGSFLPEMPRFQWLWSVIEVWGPGPLNKMNFVFPHYCFCFPITIVLSILVGFPTIQAWTTSFYMGRFGGETPKRHRLWSNDRVLLDGISRRAGYMSREEQMQCPGQTTRKYMDRNGIKRHVGIKHALRNSQYLASQDMLLFSCSATRSRKCFLPITAWWSIGLGPTFLTLRHFTRSFGDFVASLVTTRCEVPWYLNFDLIHILSLYSLIQAFLCTHSPHSEPKQKHMPQEFCAT